MEEVVALYCGHDHPNFNGRGEFRYPAKTVYSAFRTIGITEMPVTHGEMFVRWCKK
jgi:hypothetical protein